MTGYNYGLGCDGSGFGYGDGYGFGFGYGTGDGDGAGDGVVVGFPGGYESSAELMIVAMYLALDSRLKDE